MKKKGIDISYHNGKIDFDELKGKIDFAILRCGYGKNHIDTKFHDYAYECERLGIPYGVYWFSYATNVTMAKDEANYCCDALSDHILCYPVAFDYEYGSDNFASKNGKRITNALRCKMAVSFLDTIAKRGYYPILYTNEDYIANKGFANLIGKYDLWYARYNNDSDPKRECDIWQYGTEQIGSLKKVDVNWCYKDYPQIINPYYNMHGLDNDTITQIINESDLYYLNRDYINIAYDIIQGKYGTGKTRKNKIEELGFNYEITQSVVNTMLRIKG